MVNSNWYPANWGCEAVREVQGFEIYIFDMQSKLFNCTWSSQLGASQQLISLIWTCFEIYIFDMQSRLFNCIQLELSWVHTPCLHHVSSMVCSALKWEAHWWYEAFEAVNLVLASSWYYWYALLWDLYLWYNWYALIWDYIIDIVTLWDLYLW